MVKESSPPRSHDEWYGRLTIVFFAVHAVYWLAGVRFDTGSLGVFVQYLDPVLLENRLLESLWYLHTQPPVFNAFLGFGLKLVGGETVFFPTVFILLGLNLYLCTYALQVKLGIGRWIAATAATLLMASPGFILWEHFLLYTLPCASLLALAAVLLFPAVERGSRFALVGFFGCLLLVCGMRSLFHWLYLALLVLFLILCVRQYGPRMAVAGAIALLLLGSVYVKNYTLFGTPGVSSFSSKNLWIMTAGNIGWEDKKELVNDREISQYSMINRWASLDAYPIFHKEVPEEFQGIPALEMEKKFNGEVNYNHFGFIEIAQYYGEDAWHILTNKPEAYLAALAISTYRYFGPTHHPPVSPSNKRAMPWSLSLYESIVYGQLPMNTNQLPGWFRRAGFAPFVFLLFGLPLAWLNMLRHARRAWLDEGRGSARFVVLGMALFTIVVVTVLGCALDFHETARYRFLIAAFSTAAVGLLVQDVYGLVRRKWRGESVAAPGPQ